MLSYGALIWARETFSEDIKKRLRGLQRLTLTSMGFFRRSTPTAGLEAITFTTLLHILPLKSGCNTSVQKSRGNLPLKIRGHTHYM